MAKIKNMKPIPSEELVQNLNELSSELSPKPEVPLENSKSTNDHDSYKPKQ